MVTAGSLESCSLMEFLSHLKRMELIYWPEDYKKEFEQTSICGCFRLNRWERPMFKGQGSI